jgi:hypothetical protein
LFSSIPSRRARAGSLGYSESTAFGGPYRADQLLLPFAVAGGGTFTTVKPELRPIAPVTAYLLLEDMMTASSAELGNLPVQALPVRRYACVAEKSQGCAWTDFARKFARAKWLVILGPLGRA